MTSFPVTGSGPIGFTTPTGAYFTVPMSTVTCVNGVLQFGSWTPPVGALDPVSKWVSYLFQNGEIVIAPGGAQPPPGPAFLVEAVYAGHAGKTLTIDISNVSSPAPNPPSLTTMKMVVSYTETYGNVAVDSIDDVLGTTPNGGSTPGLVYVDPTSLPASAPDGSTGPFNLASGKFTIPGAVAATTAFVLLPVDNTDGFDTFKVGVTGSDPCTVTVTWTKTATGKLSDLKDAFSCVIAISAPPGDYGVPVDPTHIDLNNGTDSSVVAPTPASATVPSAPQA